MSNALAIGAVTAVIKNLLENGLVQQGISTSLGETPAVTVLSPSPDSTNGAAPKDRLNLFMYQTVPNSVWRNHALPSRNSSGDRISNPPLALDLLYLLTAYSQQSFHAEIMLGYAMQLLHETPVLPRELIRSVLRNLVISAQPAEKALATADLADQVEQIKITPQPMGTEEVSKLWSAIQTQYRPTAMYHVSVVLIEAQRSLKSSLPVQERRLFVLPTRQIVITELQPQIVTQGSVLTLKGENLKAESMQIQFGPVAIAPTRSDSREVQVMVPSGLQAGISTVQVIHLLNLGDPSGVRRIFESNVMPFVLRPRVLRAEAPAGVVNGRVDINISVEPPIGKGQQVTLWLNEQNSDDTAHSYSAIAAKRDADMSLVTIPVTGIKAGQYWVRVQVDGAESLPEVNADLQYTGAPAVAIVCTRNCLRVSPEDITLITTDNGSMVEIVGRVLVKTEATTAVSGVTVAIAWTLPDGSSRTETASTLPDGSVTFRTLGPSGTYTLTVTRLSKPGFCFDPPEDTTQSPPRRRLPAKSTT